MPVLYRCCTKDYCILPTLYLLRGTQIIKETMDELQKEVDEGRWRTDQAFLDDIFNRYLTLIELQEGNGVNDFGSADFWGHVLNGKFLARIQI